MKTIVVAGDLLLKVKEWDHSVRLAPGQAPVILRKEEFLVSKEVVTKSSTVLHMQINYHQNSSHAKEVFTIEEDRVKTMEIWLQVIHKAVTEESYDVPINEMWELAATSDKYELDVTKLYAWFGVWYSRYGKDPAPHHLLFPCWRYNNAKGFLDASRDIVYFSRGHAGEKNPTEHYQHHLPPRIVQQINAAKGRLRTILHAGLFEPVERLLVASCKCKAETLFGYIKALHDTRVWPLDPVWPKMRVNDILDALENFSYQPAVITCSWCIQDYTGMMDSAVKKTRKYFDGLCLDCMDRSKPKTGDEDSDYWQHNELREGEWDSGCRVNHGQPTWYFSFMGRKERRDLLLKHLRQQRRPRYVDHDSIHLET